MPAAAPSTHSPARPATQMPEALRAALANDKLATQRFEALAPSCRREYCEWIGSAKKDDTRARRVQQALALISEGKDRNRKHATR